MKSRNPSTAVTFLRKDVSDLVEHLIDFARSPSKAKSLECERLISEVEEALLPTANLKQLLVAGHHATARAYVGFAKDIYKAVDVYFAEENTLHKASSKIRQTIISRRKRVLLVKRVTHRSMAGCNGLIRKVNAFLTKTFIASRDVPADECLYEASALSYWFTGRREEGLTSRQTQEKFSGFKVALEQAHNIFLIEEGLSKEAKEKAARRTNKRRVTI